LLFDILCKMLEERDYDEFEVDEGKEASVVSSTMGSCCSRASICPEEEDGGGCDKGNEEEWEKMTSDKRDALIGKSLNKLKVKKKAEMSSFIMKDMLGDNADAAIKDIKAKDLKDLRSYPLRVNEVYRAVKYFNQKFEVRRQRLKENLQKSLSKTYTKRRYSFRDDYYAMMRELDGKD